jgi:poly(A) polymerase
MKQPAPTIIARQDHGISRSMLDPNALKALYRLHDHGFDARLVGGCVRDLLLGREPKDFDLVTDATPAQIKRLFRNCRLVGRRFRLAHLHYGDAILEVATFRAVGSSEDVEEGAAGTAGNPPRMLKDADGVVLRDNLFGSPAEDAWRRDFTINALSYAITDFSVVDYVGGMRDLQQGVIRTIGDPWERFTEDPVRMIRAVRFAAALGFTLEESTRVAVYELAPTIVRAAPARLFEEVLKLFLGGAAGRVYRGLEMSGLYAALFPHHAAWLARTDLAAHAWHGRVLDELDRRVQGGEKIAPALFLALLFGDYLEEAVAQHVAAGNAYTPAVDAAIATWLEEVLPRVHIQRRVALQVREILLTQRRFAAMPGKKPQLLPVRPGFPLALDYLVFCATVRPQLAATARWWQAFAAAEPAPPAREEAAAGKPRRRARRRRRRPRSAQE